MNHYSIVLIIVFNYWILVMSRTLEKGLEKELEKGLEKGLLQHHPMYLSYRPHKK